MASTLQLNLLGTLELTLGGQPLLTLRSQKGIALLVYLACNPGPQRREFLADLLWDASSTAQSLSNLRTVLSRLRSHTPDHLLITPETIAIAPDCELHTDVAALERQIGSAAEHLSASSAPQLAEALGLLRGDFLAGFHLRDASGFEQWAIRPYTGLNSDKEM
jgi:DNA-binding SARP family transcriptional activator